MRKMLVVLVLVGCLGFSAFGALSFGVKASFDTGLTVYRPDQNDSGFGPSFSIGGFLDLSLAGRFGFHPELLFYFNQARIVNESGSDQYEEYRELMIEIPLLFKYAIPVKPEISFVVLAEPVVSFGLGTPQTREASGGSTTAWSDVGDGYKNGNSALALGAGLELKKIIIDLRFAFEFYNKLDAGSETYRIHKLSLSCGLKL